MTENRELKNSPTGVQGDPRNILLSQKKKKKNSTDSKSQHLCKLKILVGSHLFRKIVRYPRMSIKQVKPGIEPGFPVLQAVSLPSCYQANILDILFLLKSLLEICIF